MTIGTLKNSEKKIVIFSGSAYNFDEYLKPLIIELINKFNIFFIQSDFYLNQNKYLINELKQLSIKYKNFNFTTYQLPEEKPYSLKKHILYKKFSKDFKLENYDFFFMVTDFSLFDLYNLNYLKKFETKTVLLFCNTLRNTFIEYIENKNTKLLISKKIKKNSNIFIIKNLLRVILFKFKKLIYEFYNYKIVPLILIKTYFKVEKYYKFACPQGNCDFTFTFDKFDYNLLKKIYGQNVMYLVNHPSYFYRNFYLQKNNSNNNKKMLILLSCYDREMFPSQINYWIEAINFFSKKYLIKKLDIRFHPRTDKKLKWPGILVNKLNKFNIKLINANDEPLINNLDIEYKIIIGSTSGSLKSISSFFRGKIICLLNSNGKLNETKNLLGSGENIIFINNKNEIDNFDQNNYKEFVDKESFSKKFLQLIN